MQYSMGKTYIVSTHSLKPTYTYVDSGVSSGIAEDDAHCITTCADNNVSIIGIDNQQLSLTHLITAGGFS